jgi:hypothetical protein
MGLTQMDAKTFVAMMVPAGLVILAVYNILSEVFPKLNF